MAVAVAAAPLEAQVCGSRPCAGDERRNGHGYEPTTSLQKIVSGSLPLSSVLKLDWNEGALPPPVAVSDARDARGTRVYRQGDVARRSRSNGGDAHDIRNIPVSDPDRVSPHDEAARIDGNGRIRLQVSGVRV